MIKENIDKLRTRDFVTRICDHCGKEDKVTLDQIRNSENRKKYGKDYCKKCSYIYRVLNHPKGKNSTSWKGGMPINKTSGYLRINRNNEYYHKVIFGNHIGRKIDKEEQIHHIDMDKLNNKIVFIPSRKPTCKFLWRNGKYYEGLYIGNRKYIAYYRFIIEEFTGKKLHRDIQVHHIDGNTLNNDINNIVALSRKQHRKCHNSLQNCVIELYKMGIVKFSREIGKYYV